MAKRALGARCVVERVRDPRRAREIYLASVELGRGLDRSILSDAGRAQHALVLVELGEYVAELEAAGAPDFSDFEARQRGFFSEALVRCALALGRREQAEELSERAVEDARDLGLPVVAGVTMRARATVLATRGDRASAAQGAQMAIEAAEAQAAQGARIDAARSRIVAGRALVGAGDREAAERELETALRALEECGARHHRDEAAAELRALGRRVARRLGAAPAGEGALAALSPRELEVARVVAEGRTNKLVAEQLFLSERTVEGHLSRSFEKLGISSRVELARMVLGR